MKNCIVVTTDLSICNTNRWIYLRSQTTIFELDRLELIGAHSYLDIELK